MIKTDCVVHTILHPSFKELSGKWFVLGRSMERFVSVCVSVCGSGGEIFWGRCSISESHYLRVKKKRKKRESTDPGKG